MSALDVAESQDLFFNSLIEGYVKGNRRFLRRDWLAKELETKLAEPRHRFVLLTAEPGAGKSAFVAQLAHDHPEWLRYFIRRDQHKPLADVSDRSFLLRIGYQLAARRPELFAEEQVRLSVSVEQHFDTVAEQAKAIGIRVKRLLESPFHEKALRVVQHVQANQGSVIGLQVDELVVEPHLLAVADLLHLALVSPAKALARLEPGRKIVILIDALDEIRYQTTAENVLAWLTNCPGELPENIRFVLSSRPPDEALKLFCSKQADRLSELAIDENDPYVQHDVDTFVTNLIGEPALGQALEQTEGGAPAFAARATDKAHGNLGYLDALARGIDQAIGQKDATTLEALLSLGELPADLEGLYAFFLHQIKQGVAGQQIVGKDATGKTYSADAWPAVYDPILGVLAVAAEPLSVDQIHRLGAIVVDVKWVYQALNQLRQFLDVVDGRRRFYHATVGDFLTLPSTHEATETEDIYQDARQRHRQVVDHYLNQYGNGWATCPDDYGFEHLVNHIIASGFPPNHLVRILQRTFTVDFINERGRRSGWHLPLVRDLGRVRDIAPEAVVQPCFRALVGDFPNSLASQQALRLLSGIRRDLLNRGDWDAQLKDGLEREVDKILAMLADPADEAARKLIDYLGQRATSASRKATRTEVRLRAIAALALGETGSVDAIKPLVSTMVGKGEAQVSWAAADGLLALRDQSVVRPLFDTLESPGVSHWAKNRALYVLGRLPAIVRVEQKMEMIDKGLRLRQDCRIRAVDAIYLLRPGSPNERAAWDAHYEKVLQDGLGSVGVAVVTKPGSWSNARLRRRAVVALGRIGSSSTIRFLEALLGELLKGKGVAGHDDMIEATRRALEEVKRAVVETTAG